MAMKKEIKLRVSEDIYSQIKEESGKRSMSTNSLLLHVVANNLGNTKGTHEEDLSKKSKERKSIRSTIRLTRLEAEKLSKFAKENGWKITEEIRYRILGTLNNSGNINEEELKTIRGIRASINALGTNINTIIREGRIVDQDGKDICMKLAEKIKEAIIGIEEIVEKSKVRFMVRK